MSKNGSPPAQDGRVMGVANPEHKPELGFFKKFRT
jgi:hypothetical protein